MEHLVSEFYEGYNKTLETAAGNISSQSTQEQCSNWFSIFYPISIIIVN